MRFRGNEDLEVISEESEGQDCDQSSVHNREDNEDDEDNLSEYSTQSFNSDDLLEGSVAATNRFEIEQANCVGVSRTKFLRRKAL